MDYMQILQNIPPQKPIRHLGSLYSLLDHFTHFPEFSDQYYWGFPESKLIRENAGLSQPSQNTFLAYSDLDWTPTPTLKFFSQAPGKAATIKHEHVAGYWFPCVGVIRTVGMFGISLKPHPWWTAFGKFHGNFGNTARKCQGNWKTQNILNVSDIFPKFSQNLPKMIHCGWNFKDIPSVLPGNTLDVLFWLSFSLTGWGHCDCTAREIAKNTLNDTGDKDPYTQWAHAEYTVITDNAQPQCTQWLKNRCTLNVSPNGTTMCPMVKNQVHPECPVPLWSQFVHQLQIAHILNVPYQCNHNVPNGYGNKIYPSVWIKCSSGVSINHI